MFDESELYSELEPETKKIYCRYKRQLLNDLTKTNSAQKTHHVLDAMALTYLSMVKDFFLEPDAEGKTAEKLQFMGNALLNLLLAHIITFFPELATIPIGEYLTESLMTKRKRLLHVVK